MNLIGCLYYNKYSKNTDFYKLIEGTLGSETSLKFLLRIIKFVKVANETCSKEKNGKLIEEDVFFNKIMDESCTKKVNHIEFIKFIHFLLLRKN